MDTITVGSGGTFATLNTALAYASNLRPTYTAPTVEIRLLAGYQEIEGVSLTNLDLGYINLTAVAEVVQARVPGDLFTATNAKLPTINCKFDMANMGGHGIFLAQSSVLVGQDAGVIRAGKSGLCSIADSRFSILDADFFGANEFGAYIDHASHGHIGNTDFSNAGRRGGPPGTYNGIHVRHSSYLNLGDGAVVQLGSSPSSNDIAVQFGGMIDVTRDVVGGFTQAPNILTANGVIFRP